MGDKPAKNNNELFIRLINHAAWDPITWLAGFGGKKQSLDFLGVNYYFRSIIQFSLKNKGLFGLIGEESLKDERYAKSEKNDLEWEVYPRGLSQVLKEAYQKYKLPLMITENGICTGDDDQRRRFIKAHVTEVYNAITDGAQVLGYMYWSLLDNYEWSLGYFPRFGLVHVDFQTHARNLKDSGKYYAQICRLNEIPND